MGKRRRASLNLLFIGNSFTARNDVPGLIAALAGARGKKVEHRLISAGGASLRRHWNKGEALQAIRSGKYDGVVLQEQSTLPIKNPARMRESVLLFDEAIRDAGAETLLYMTWARAHAPESQRAITEAYTSVGREIAATVVPVGVAWERLLEGKEHPVLHDKDGSHPTLAGSYLAACVFLGVLFGESPIGVGAPIDGLGTKDRLVLERAAADALSSEAAATKR